MSCIKLLTYKFNSRTPIIASSLARPRDVPFATEFYYPDLKSTIMQIGSALNYMSYEQQEISLEKLRWMLRIKKTVENLRYDTDDARFKVVGGWELRNYRVEDNQLSESKFDVIWPNSQRNWE